MKPRNPTDEVNQFGTYDYVIDELIHDAVWVTRAFYDLDHPKHVPGILFRQLPEYAFMALQAQRAVLVAMSRWPLLSTKTQTVCHWRRVPVFLFMMVCWVVAAYNIRDLSPTFTAVVVGLMVLTGFFVPFPISSEWSDDLQARRKPRDR